MKHIATIILILVGAFAHGQTYNLEITVTNIKEIKGKITLSLYNDEKFFPKEGQEFRTASIPVNGNIVKYSFTGLPFGEYAVALFHDKNSDGICNRNFLGKPKEGYGFSRNYNPKLSAPDFKDCKILLNRNLQINIELIQ